MDINIAKQLCALQSYEPLKYVLNEAVFSDMQSVVMAKALYSKKALISLGTGMGKTLVADGLMIRILKANPGKRFIFVGKDLQKDETPAKLMKYSNLKVGQFSGRADDFERFIRTKRNYDVLFLTIKGFTSMRIQDELFEMKDEIIGIVLDEVHSYCNYKESDEGQILESFTAAFEYVYGLTATPMNSGSEQMANVLRIIDRDAFPDKRAFEDAIKTMNAFHQCKIILVERPVNMNIGTPLFVEPMEHQRNSRDILVVKGKGATNQINMIANCCKHHVSKGEQGLVYIRRIEVRDTLHEELNNSGLRVATIYRDDAVLPNGTYTSSARVCDMFRNKELDIVLTCKTEALDLPCEFVAFYELTMDVQQFIGRACRGLDSKPVYVYFLITVGTFEVKFFYNNVYSRAEEIQEKLKQDRSETVAIGDLLIKKIGKKEFNRLMSDE